MTMNTIYALLGGTLAMLLLIVVLMKSYSVALWKSIPVSLILTITGTVGTYIWFFVENSWFGGRSYYGAVFFVPLAFFCFAKVMRMAYGDLMDFCAPAECIMLAIMKYQCLIDGCCAGKTLRFFNDSFIMVFPSQMVELGNALLLVVVLMVIALKQKHREKVYPLYMILYGTSRFILNWFRKDAEPLLMGLPEGNVWSLLAIAVGIMWLLDYKISITKKNAQNN